MRRIFTLIANETRFLSVLLLCVMLLSGSKMWGQITIQPNVTVSENFDGIGVTATAALPTGWKMDKNAAVRTLGTYAAAVSATERSDGNSMSTSASNGLYNFGAGVAASATDRAVGGLSSSSASKSVNVYLALTNNGLTTIPSFNVSFDVEKYRNGSNTAGFSVQMYYSTDGSTWTSAGSDFNVSFAADADNAGYTSAPGSFVSITSKSLAQTLAVGSTLFLAWNYSVTTGTTSSNAQALGLDNVSIAALDTPTAITTPSSNAKLVKTSYFTIGGAEVTAPVKGLYIEKNFYDDGAVVTRKVVK